MGCNVSSPIMVKATIPEDIGEIRTETPIKHVVLLMLENRSFDQIFGYRNDYEAPYKVNGISNADNEDETTRFFNLDKDGTRVYQNPMVAFTGHDDATHDLEATLFSINGCHDGVPKEKLSGFILANQLKMKSSSNAEHTDPIPPAEIMGYFLKDSFPVYEYIADNFVVCDNWFSSVPSATLPNRAFGLCASSDGHINNKCKTDHKQITYRCPTIFDRLNEKHFPWKVYYHDMALSLTLEHQIKARNLQNYCKFEKFKDDVSRGALPAFAFFEPEYGVESSLKKIDSVANGQNLVFDILATLQSNPQVYNNTLFVVYYDEAGGFYDHVYPPPAPAPQRKEHVRKSEYTFDQYGQRVPAMLVSPYSTIRVYYHLWSLIGACLL